MFNLLKLVECRGSSDPEFQTQSVATWYYRVTNNILLREEAANMGPKLKKQVTTKLPKMSRGRKMTGKNKEEDTQGILEGISSLHSWIKTQTMIRPSKMFKNKKEAVTIVEEDEDVVISLSSKDLQISKSIVRFDYNTLQFVHMG